jgi:hypothetical protein
LKLIQRFNKAYSAVWKSVFSSLAKPISGLAKLVQQFEKANSAV